MQVLWAAEALSDHAWGGHIKHRSVCLHDGIPDAFPVPVDAARAVFFGRFVAETVILPRRRMLPKEKLQAYLTTCRATPLLPFGIPGAIFDRTWVFCNGGAIPIPSLLQQLHARFGTLNNHRPSPGRRTAPLHFRFFEYMLREKLGVSLWTGFFAAHRMGWDDKTEVQSYRGFFRSTGLFALDDIENRMLAPVRGARGYMQVPFLDGTEVLRASQVFDPKAMYWLPLRIGHRPPGGNAVTFPDWICWEGKRRGRDRERAIRCSSVVKDTVLAVGFDKTEDGKVTVYRNPEDIDKLYQAWKYPDGNMVFIFAASWSVCNLKDLTKLMEEESKKKEGTMEEEQEEQGAMEDGAMEEEAADCAQDIVIHGEVGNYTPSVVNQEEQLESSEGELFMPQ